MIRLTKIRDLDLAPAPGTDKTHLSAASGLVGIGPLLYVIGDDELHLGVFRTNPSTPGYTIRLFPGELPVPKKERKARKPELEALMLIAACPEFPTGAMLALGSGSRSNRWLGSLLLLDEAGAVQSAPSTIDLSPLYRPLDDAFDELNIDGAVVIGDDVCLFQRGNKGSSENAIVRLPLASFVGVLNGEPEVNLKPDAIRRIDLGRCEGIPFCFTDAAALPNGEIVFTAVAEDTEDSYSDGPCAGAGIGLIGRDGELRRFMPLDARYKVEGVDAQLGGDVIRLLLVSDADDPAVPAALFSAVMER